MKAVAVSGKSGAGGSTLARLLVDELRAAEVDVLFVTLADALVAEVEREYGLSKGERGFPAKLREHYEQRLGEDPGYWLKRLRSQVRRLSRSGVVALVPEVDRRREADCLRELGALLVRVEAPPGLRAARLEARGLDPALARSKQPMETELDDYEFDVVVRNAASLQHLRRQAAKLVPLLLASSATGARPRQATSPPRP